jgi:hypothetical protein
VHIAGVANVDRAMAGAAVVEGALLARYRVSVAQHGAAASAYAKARGWLRPRQEHR